MAFFKKGPPGKRGIGFGGFNLKGEEPEPSNIQPNPEFGKSSDKEPQRKAKPSSEPSRKLSKLTDEE